MIQADSGRNFSILITGGFSTLAYSSIVSCLGATNDVLGREAYRWETVSPEGSTVPSDVSAVFKARKISLDDSELIRSARNEIRALLCGTEFIDGDHRLIPWLRVGLARGAKVLSFGRTTRLLAEQNVIHDRRCAVHWKDFGVAAERFPNIRFTRTYLEIDDPFYTCASDTSVFRLVLKIVEEDFGREVAESVASETLQPSSGDESVHQKPPFHAKLERSGSPILMLVKMMEESLSEPIDVKTLVDNAGLSRRQVERLFERDMGTSPKKFYLRLRLNRAHELLKYSSMPVIDVAIATGFVSASHFSKAFKAAFGLIPSDCRRSG